MRVAVLGAAFLLTAAAAAPMVTLSFQGYGLVHFGDSLADAEERLNEHPRRKDAPGGESCHYVEFASYPGVSFMVEDGHIVTAEPPPDAPNILGIKIGMTLPALRAKFRGRTLKVEEYGDGGHYVAIKSPDKTSEIRVEIADDAVAYVQGGLLPAVEYVEGCL